MRLHPLLALYLLTARLGEGIGTRFADGLAEARENPERGDGGPIPTAVIIAAVLAAAIALAIVIANAVSNHSASIN
jgi:hypothetical protein